jgi:hypothetical protein
MTHLDPYLQAHIAMHGHHRRYAPDDTRVLLAGNKTDLASMRAVTELEGR